MTEAKEDKQAVGASFDVKDPQDIVPESLPFIVTPKNGKWANKEQEEYAKVVNAYAYKNRKKWAQNQVDPRTGAEIPNTSKRDILLKQLESLEKNPGLIFQLRGGESRVSYNDKAYGQNVLDR